MVNFTNLNYLVDTLIHYEVLLGIWKHYSKYSGELDYLTFRIDVRIKDEGAISEVVEEGLKVCV